MKIVSKEKIERKGDCKREEKGNRHRRVREEKWLIEKIRWI